MFFLNKYFENFSEFVFNLSILNLGNDVYANAQ
jgi:hypothetical protein